MKYKEIISLMAYKIVKGGYPDLNREQAVPHTVTLPLSYIHLYSI